MPAGRRDRIVQPMEIVRRADAALASVLTLAMMVAALVTGPVDLFARAGAAVVALGLLALAVRRRHPFAAALAVAVVIVVDALAAPTGTQAPAFLALMVAGYTLGVHARPAALAGGVLCGCAAVATVQLALPSQGYSHASAITFFASVLVLAPAAIGGVVRLRSGAVRRVRAGTAQLRASAAQSLAAGRTQHGERVGAQVQRVVLDGLESMRRYAEVRDLAEVIAVRDRGRDLLSSMRRLLTALREPGAEQSPRAPGDGLAQLRSQVRRVLADGAGPPVAPRVRWVLHTPRRLDLTLAVAAGVYALLAGAAQLTEAAPAGRRVLVCAAAALAALPAAGARRWPLAATALGVAAGLGFGWLAPAADPLAGLVAGAVLIGYPLIVGALADAGRAVLGLALCLATAVLASAAHPGGLPAGSDLVAACAVAVGSWVAGRVLRAGATTLAESAAAAVAEEQRQLAELRAALGADRARVARDLHDAVGHAVTGIVLQATAAARVWETEPALAARHVADLRGTLAEALDDLRPLVASVALDDPESPGLAALAELVDHAGACGLSVRAVVDGVAVPLDPELDTVAYRVLQEALTNAARHAPGATVLVRIGYRPDSLTLSVTSTPSPPGTGATGGSGHGLRGMAERVASRAGQLRAGATTTGGFEVYAVLPVPGAAVTALDGASGVAR